MTHDATRRLRDPLHGLIRFDGSDEIDRLAWDLINTPAFQRLRRIKQLGFSEYVFPGATHSRFSHSIGVYHTARILLRVVRREIGGAPDEHRAAVALFAALLHDVGHGPFSHTFEGVQKTRGIKKHHEAWSFDIILSAESGIPQVFAGSVTFQGIEKEVARLLTLEDPEDIYHAIVSSSFDADRLDYMRRDKMMTGSGAGSIDFDWLLDSIRIANLDLFATDESQEVDQVPTFVLSSKALQPAESFLIGRYHLYEQVYFHKTTRGFEIALGECLKAAADIVKHGNWSSELGLTDGNPLVVFLQESDPSVSQYLQLDDTVIWGALERMSEVNTGKAGEFARRIMLRKPMKCLDFETLPTIYGLDPLEANARMRSFCQGKLDESIFKDDPKLSCYGAVGADEIKIHKRIAIDIGDRKYREITAVSDVLGNLAKPKPLTRFYFTDDELKETALDVIRNKKG